jgi:nicotinate-nucleotide--dimethylbenzimidazole phosphoribosyltransferase
MGLLENALRSIAIPDEAAGEHAQKRLDSLTKPRGSLGRLEEVVRRYAAARADGSARWGGGAVAVFVADHGVAEEGVSAYPKAVTAQMLRNIAQGGAAISVLTHHLGFQLKVVDVGVEIDTSSERLPDVAYRRIGPGTKNFLRSPAMSLAEATRAIEVGIDVAREVANSGATLIGIGEMGIANSTPAAALLCAATGLAPEAVAGRGTGIDDRGYRRKVEVVQSALKLHRGVLSDPLGALAALGGFEIAAMAGVCLGGASARTPVVVDGFIATAAAACAERIAPRMRDYLFFSHRSGEGGHALVLERLGARPILDLDMRLGEGTGAALAMAVIRSALELFHNMATFSGAGVSEKIR